MPEQITWTAVAEGRSPEKRKQGSFGRYMSEKRERALRLRIADCLLRGAGTVWGLHAAVGDVETHGRRTRVLVRAGLAIDPLGRELYVDREQCLDVEGLANHPIWRELLPPPGAASPSVRRAYIVLRQDDCPAPAEQATVSHGDSHAASLSRRVSRPSPPPVDRFRIELCPIAPPSPNALRSQSLSTLLGERDDALDRPQLALLLQDGGLPGAEPPACPLPDAAPLLLASLDLDLAGATVFIVPGTPVSPNPDNRPRASVPGVRAMAECLFGKKLSR